MNSKNKKDLQNDSSIVQTQESGAQAPIPESEQSLMAAGRAILDEVMNQSGEAAKRMKELMDMRIRSSPLLPPAKTILSVNDVSIIEANDFFLIKGKPKSGKGSILKAYICAILVGQWGPVKAFIKNMKILYIDTEQKPQDCQSILLYAKELSGVSDEYLDDHIMLFSVRKRDRNKLVDDLIMLATTWKPQMIVIDGLADFVNSFNDETESSQLIHSLLCICEENDCAIIGLIHENKAIEDTNAKGHLGSLGTQKAALVIEARKVGDIIKVCSSEARHKSMPDWYLAYDDCGMLIDGSELFESFVSTRTEGLREANKAKSEQLKKERLDTAYAIIRANNGRISRNELAAKMAEQFDRDRSTMSSFIGSQLGKTLFLVNDMVQESPDAILPF